MSNLLDHCRQKLWMYISLEDVEISKAKEEHLKKILKENRDIEEDIGTLRMIGKISKKYRRTDRFIGTGKQRFSFKLFYSTD